MLQPYLSSSDNLSKKLSADEFLRGWAHFSIVVMVTNKVAKNINVTAKSFNGLI